MRSASHHTTIDRQRPQKVDLLADSSTFLHRIDGNDVRCRLAMVVGILKKKKSTLRRLRN